MKKWITAAGLAVGGLLVATPVIAAIALTFAPAAMHDAVGYTCQASDAGRCGLPEPATFGLIGVALAVSLVPAALRRRKDAADEA